MNQSTTNTGTSTIGSLLAELRSESTTLFRQEVALAKAELTEKANVAANASLGLARGGAVAQAGLIVLLLGVGQLLAVGLIKMGLRSDLAVWLGPVGVGVVAGSIGFAMVTKAKKAFRAENFGLTETMGSFKDDKQWVQSKIQHAQQ